MPYYFKLFSNVLIVELALPDDNGNGGATPLMGAAETGHARIVQMLIDAKADIENSGQEQYDRTPVFVAAQFGRSDVLTTLIAAKADIEKPCSEGITSLEIAVVNDHLGSTEVLLDAGAICNVRDSIGKLPVEYAKTDKMRQLFTKKRSRCALSRDAANKSSKQKN